MQTGVSAGLLLSVRIIIAISHDVRAMQAVSELRLYTLTPYVFCQAFQGLFEMNGLCLAESSDGVREIRLSSIRARARWRLFSVLHANPSLRSMRKKNVTSSQVMDEIDKSEDLYTRSRAVSAFRRKMSTVAAASQFVVITENVALLGRA